MNAREHCLLLEHRGTSNSPACFCPSLSKSPTPSHHSPTRIVYFLSILSLEPCLEVQMAAPQLRRHPALRQPQAVCHQSLQERQGSARLLYRRRRDATGNTVAVIRAAQPNPTAVTTT
ncbi:hypothetical protein Vafri_8446 [Volvox africanus]|nr:hypothetical protein Vafri_8446 [Volvox africanus]